MALMTRTPRASTVFRVDKSDGEIVGIQVFHWATGLEWRERQ